MGRKTILFIDDSLFVRRRMEEALDNEDFDVTTLADGADALDWIEGHPPADLVITDLHMPHMSGIDLIDRLRAHRAYRKAPIFVLTSGADHDEKERVRIAGATAWIVKPFDRDKLVTAIRRVVHQGEMGTSPFRA